MKYFFLILLSLYSNLVMADCDSAVCSENEEVKTLDQVLMTKLEALKECPTPDELIFARVKKEYDGFYGHKKKIKTTVKGYMLEGTAEELKLAGKMLGAKPPKGWAAAAKACSNIQCAFEKLLGSKTAAMQVMNLHARDGLFLSLDQSINNGLKDQIWSAREIQELDASASKLPPELLHLKIEQVDRIADGLRRSGHDMNVGAFASPLPELVVYDTGLRGTTSGADPYATTSWPQEVLIHELCHHHDFKGYYDHGSLTSSTSKSVFGAISGWKKSTDASGKDSWTRDPKAQFVSWYAETSPAEDYAESCMNYLLHPEVLAQKAPKKYEYMKKYVFKGKEYKDKIWAQDKNKNWPKLNDLLAADDTGCMNDIADCMKNLKYEWGMFADYEPTKEGSTVTYAYGGVLAQIQKNKCVNQVKINRLNAVGKVLEQESNFCDKGGLGAIQLAQPRVCEGSIKALASGLEAVTKFDYGPLVQQCEKDKDYSYACIENKTISSLKLPEASKKLALQVMKDKLPNRMQAMSKLLDTTNSTLWLKSCLDAISGISMYETSGTSSNGSGQNGVIFDFQSADPNYKSAYLGEYIHTHYTYKDANMACANKMVESFEKQGYKTPEIGNSVDMMSSTFKNELNSFKTTVLLNINSRIKKCIGLKKCKTRKILELIQTWEAESPESRAGMSTEEFATSIMTKWGK